MNSLSLVKGNIGKKLSSALSTVSTFPKCTNTGLSVLLKPLLAWCDNIRSAQASWDALLSPVAASDDILFKMTDRIEALEHHDFIDVSTDEAATFAQGFSDACEFNGNILSESEVNNSVISITSSVGQVFNFQVVASNEQPLRPNVLNVYANGADPLIIYNNDGTARIRRFIKPAGFVDSPTSPEIIQDNVLSYVQWIASMRNLDYRSSIKETLLQIDGASGSTIIDIINSILDMYQLAHAATIVDGLSSIVDAIEIPSSKGFVQSLGSLFINLFKSQSINQLVLSTVDAIRNSKLGSFISNLLPEDHSSFESVTRFKRELVNAYNSGGLSNVVTTLLSLSRSANSVEYDDESGILIFSDNNQLCPKDFMCGFVQTLTSSLRAVASAIALLFKGIIRLAGIALSVIGSIIDKIKNAASGLTKAKLVDSDDINGSVINMPFCPYGFFQREIEFDMLDQLDHEFCSWYLTQVQSGSTLWYLEVTGGMILIGPGSFDDNAKPTSIRYEFHPTVCMYSDVLFTHYSMTDDGINHFQLEDLIDTLELNGYECETADECYQILQEHFSVPFDNDSDGYIERMNSFRITGAIALNTYLFYLTCVNSQNLAEVLAWRIWCNTQKPITDGEEFAKLMCMIERVFFSFEGPTLDGNWEQVAAAAIESGYIDDPALYGGWVDPTSATAELGSYLSLKWTSDTIKCFHQFYEQPHSVSSSFQWAIIPPSYTARSLITAAVIAGAVVLVVSAIAVFATVKFAKWAKRKRADNVARYASSQDDYRNACAGIKEEWSEEQGKFIKTQFDTNSAEGKAYINECYKTYKRTAIKNNLWQKIVGGSRYDVSTYWGEADSYDDSSELFSEIQNQEDEMYAMAESPNDLSALATDQNSITMNGLYTVITGKQWDIANEGES